MKRFLSIALISIGAMFSITCRAQTFPEIWPTDKYDYTHGEKGQLDVINEDGSFYPNENKAFIFATGVNELGTLTNKDLFRLTSQGVHTFNSPFQGYDVKVDLCSKAIRQGGLIGQDNNMHVFGRNHLTLGVQDSYSIMTISSDKVSSSRNIEIDKDNMLMYFGTSDDLTTAWIGTLTDTQFVIGSGKRAAIIVDDKYRTAYFGLHPGEVRTVKGALKEVYSIFAKNGVLAENYSIAPIASWSDYVFSPSYKKPELSEVENYIQTNGHLPEVPSAEDVATNGYSQHELNMILLKKIEELTLYTIEQQKEIERLKSLVK